MQKTAFVFAGGGSLGAAQVGMLKALVSKGVEPDVVVGSSVGAINAAYFAGSANREAVWGLEQIWRQIRRRDVFPLAPVGVVLGLLSRRNYMVSPLALRRLLESHLTYHKLEDSNIPVCVVATDILEGVEVRLSSGPVVEALLASAAIPAVFAPVRIGGRYLVDGGLISSSPLFAALELGARRLIVLPTGISCAVNRPPRGAVGMALHAVNLAIARQLARDAEHLQSDVQISIVPPLCPMATAPHDFSRSGEMIDLAEINTLRWLEEGGLKARGLPRELRTHMHWPTPRKSVQGKC